MTAAPTPEDTWLSQNDPERMEAPRSNVLEGVWLTDEGGKLRVVQD